jgi:hypothetical protein
VRVVFAVVVVLRVVLTGVVTFTVSRVGSVRVVRTGVVDLTIVREELESFTVVRVVTGVLVDGVRMGVVVVLVAWHVGPSYPDLHLHAQSPPETDPVDLPPLRHFCGHGVRDPHVLPSNPVKHLHAQFLLLTDPVTVPPFKQTIAHLGVRVGAVTRVGR